jgi:hypothetical protein
MAGRLDALEAALESCEDSQQVNELTVSTSVNNIRGPCGGVTALELEVQVGAKNTEMSMAERSNEEQAPCRGCLRTRLSRCYREPQNLVTWRYADKKGAWCHDCHCLWRSVHSGNYSLAVYGGKMENDVDRQQHSLELLALNSLRREAGTAHISAGLVFGRVDVIKFVCGLLGVNAGCQRVVLLEDFISSGGAVDLGVLSRTLTTVTINAVDRLGIMVPMPTIGSASLFTRPESHDFVSFVPHIACNSVSDRALARQHLGGPEPPASCDVLALCKPAAAPLSKAMARVKVQQNQAIVVLNSFCCGDWDAKAKESMFTPLVTSFAKIYADSSSEGDGDGADASHLWLEEMTTGKKVMKLYREYVRSHYKHTKLLAMTADLLKFCTFMKKHVTGKLDAAFELLHLQAIFFNTIELGSESGAIPLLCTAFSKVLTLGMADIWDGGPEKRVGGLEAATWLRSLSCRGIATIVASVASDKVVDSICEVGQDVSNSADGLRSHWKNCDVIEPVLEELSAIACYLGAGVSGAKVTPLDAKNAALKLKGPSWWL